MSDNKPFALEENPLWKEVCDLAEYVYGTLPEFTEEEKWGLASRLRSAAAESVLWVSLAVGNPAPTGREYDWAGVRKHVSALKSLYRLAGRQKFIDLEPKIMMRLDRLLANIDKQYEQARSQSKEHIARENEDGLKPWLKKYEIWKQINQEHTS